MFVCELIIIPTSCAMFVTAVGDGVFVTFCANLSLMLLGAPHM